MEKHAKIKINVSRNICKLIKGNKNKHNFTSNYFDRTVIDAQHSIIYWSSSPSNPDIIVYTFTFKKAYGIFCILLWSFCFTMLRGIHPHDFELLR